MIKSNHNLSKCDQENTLKSRLYTLIALAIMIKLITTFISLLMTWNSILISHVSVQKTSWTFNQNKSEMRVYYTSNWQFSDWENC